MVQVGLRVSVFETPAMEKNVRLVAGKEVGTRVRGDLADPHTGISELQAQAAGRRRKDAVPVIDATVHNRLPSHYRLLLLRA